MWLPNFAYATRVQLSWHVQNFIGITSLQLGRKQNEVSTEFELQWKNRLWCGPLLTNPLQWCHNGCDGVSNHQPHHCLLNRLFERWSKKTSKHRVTGLCAGNSPVSGEFPAQMASNAENVSIWWRHHAHSITVTKSKFSAMLSYQLCPFSLCSARIQEQTNNIILPLISAKRHPTLGEQQINHDIRSSPYSLLSLQIHLCWSYLKLNERATCFFMQLLQESSRNIFVMYILLSMKKM